MSRDPEALITDCIGQYPTLFPNRTSVLHHLFIVLGCGFEWHNGELVDTCRNLTRGYQIPRADAELRAKTPRPHRARLPTLHPEQPEHHARERDPRVAGAGGRDPRRRLPWRVMPRTRNP